MTCYCMTWPAVEPTHNQDYRAQSPAVEIKTQCSCALRLAVINKTISVKQDVWMAAFVPPKPVHIIRHYPYHVH